MSPATHHPSHRVPPARVLWQPRDFPLRAPAERVLRESLRELGLEGVLHEIRVHVDASNREDHAYIEWDGRDHGSARLSFAVGNFVTRERRRAWSRTWGRREGLPPLEASQFSRRSFAEACLHELLHLRDDVDAGVDLAGRPARDREALNELWNVWIDGRLNRRGLPAMSRAERRRIYRKTLAGLPGFAARGERLFQALWSADHLGPRELRACLVELRGPRNASGPRRGAR